MKSDNRKGVTSIQRQPTDQFLYLTFNFLPSK